MPLALRYGRFVALALFFILSLTTFSFPQAGSATVSGIISDSAGLTIAGADVAATRIETGATTHSVTNRSGIYVLPDLAPGQYRILVHRQGFKEVLLKDLALEVQAKVERNFQLEVGAVSETVNVTAGGISLNTTDASVSTVVTQNFVDSMPLNGRSFQDLLTLAPGVAQVPQAYGGIGNSGEISVNGQRTEANYFTVDGTSANTGAGQFFGNGAGFSGSTAGETALGTTQSLVPIDALQEFRATTSTYSAEYGRSPGGQFSFLTRSGTNNWHGSAFDYFRNDALDANNWFNDHTSPFTQKTAERQNDFGGTLGGPVRIPGLYNGRDRTFFFVAYEGLRLLSPVPALTAQVPDSAMRQQSPAQVQAALNAFPVPNGPDLGNGLAEFTAAYSSPSHIDTTSIRIDHQVNGKLRVFGRYSDSTSATAVRNSVGGINAVSGDLANVATTNVDVKTATFGAMALMSAHLTDDFRFNFTANTLGSINRLDNFGGAVPYGVSGLNLPGFGGVYFSLAFGGQPHWQSSEIQNDQRQFNVVDNLSIVHGRHLLKMGGDYRRTSTRARPFSIFEQAYFLDAQEVLNNSASFGIALSQVQFPVEPVYSNLSLFVQDEWKATHKLALSLGVRWELNPPPGDSFGHLPYTLNQIDNLATAQLAPRGTPLWQTTYDNFAPRFGLAYQLHESSTRASVFRAGIGMYYDTGNTYASQGVQGVGFTNYVLYSGIGFPFTAAETKVPPASTAAPYGAPVYAFDPNLKLPYTLQWNASLEQSFGEEQTVKIGYVASAAHRLLFDSGYSPAAINPNFSSGQQLYLITNSGASNYNSLQAQYQRSLTHGLQALVSYTWSHAIDNVSSNGQSSELIRGNSDLDVRHNLQGAVVFSPSVSATSRTAFLFKQWQLNLRVSARSALPIDIFSSTFVAPNGQQLAVRADVVPGQSMYVAAPSAPGGRIVNYSAFTAPANGGYGNEPRNSVRGFNAVQADLGLQRDFRFTERVGLLFRAEAFNVLNHPIFGAIQNNLAYGTSQFGYAQSTLNSQLGGLNPLYQIGGPRSLQLALRVHF